MATFGDTEQLAFKTGVATIASTTVEDVTITSVAAGTTARRRHLLADSVTVAYVVATGDTSNSDNVATALNAITPAKLTTELKAAGLT